MVLIFLRFWPKWAGVQVLIGGGITEIWFLKDEKIGDCMLL